MATILQTFLKFIFLNENIWISIEISLKFVPKGPIDNILPLVHIMAWRWPGNKPLSEPMITWTNACKMKPWKQVFQLRFHYSFRYWNQNISGELVNIMAADDPAPCITRTSAAMVSTTGSTGACLLRGRISSTCVISMLQNCRKYKYVQMFPGLNSVGQSCWESNWKAIIGSDSVLLSSNEPTDKMPIPKSLTRSGLVTPYGDTDLGQHWLR